MPAPYAVQRESAEDPRRCVRGRPRLPLRLHARVVAALEGDVRGRRRLDRDAVPRPAGRVAVVAESSEPHLARGRVVRRLRRARTAQGRPLPRRARTRPAGSSRPIDARGDLARRDAALATAPRAADREGRPDAVIVFTVPMAHFRGIPTALRERFGVPVVFYDGDVPMSLPEFGGMDTGFNYYHGADPSEYDLGRLELRRRSARPAPARRQAGSDRLAQEGAAVGNRQVVRLFRALLGDPACLEDRSSHQGQDLAHGQRQGNAKG